MKFQYRNLQRSYGASPPEIGDEIVKANISRSYLGPSELIDLALYARGQGLRVGTSFFIEEDVEDLADFDFDFYKVPSSELTNLPLLRRLLVRPRDVLLSTGMSAESEIEKIWDLFGHHSNLVVLHCVSNYPTDPSNARLGNLHWLRSRFGWRVGYSSHDRDWEIALLALSLEPEFIERHLTLDKSMDGTDHTSSSEPQDFAKLVDFALRYSAIMEGRTNRVVNQGELINRQNLGRSLYLKQSAPKGARLTDQDLVYVSPQVGLNWMEWERLRETKVLEAIEADSPLLLSHFSRNKSNQTSADVLAWARAHMVSLPVRLHDFEHLDSVFGLAAYEFHLSYGEVQALSASAPASVRAGVRYTVHLPDYVDNDFLLDPFSSNPTIRKMSLDVIQRIAEFSGLLAEVSKNQVVVVCSLSNNQGCREDFYSQVRELFLSYSRHNIVFTLQWLPPAAWYFGGSVSISRVNSLEDVGFLKKLEIPITMDTSHLLMGENAGLLDASEVYDSLQDLIVHLHIAGASGVDGEGMSFDFTRDSERQILDRIFTVPQSPMMPKVIEVWQGHLNGYAGFRAALEVLQHRYADG